MNWGAFATAFGHMLLWMLCILLLIHLITWISPEQDGSPVVPDWAELVVWALFIMPIVPAMIGGNVDLGPHDEHMSDLLIL